ncbi:unnamed protein product [Adineta steineri]|uniref:Glycosyltransferase family 92 protein n=2 Tax=Adineta steineri TaxID=433720 RepID=A0A814H7E2_9BILA|nr:unnamed protein product [Adineta steineri]CAF3885508.1 unnamed protein product [Adineta steineri]
MATAWTFTFVRRNPMDSRTNSMLNVPICWFTEQHHSVVLFVKPIDENIPVHHVRQWIDYHLFLGIEYFYIYARTDLQRSALQDYVDKGVIEYVLFPTIPWLSGTKEMRRSSRKPALMHCLMEHRAAMEWMGAWDIDEYLYLPMMNSTNKIYEQTYDTHGRRSMLYTQLQQFDNYAALLLDRFDFFALPNMTDNTTLRVIERFSFRAPRSDRQFSKPLVRAVHVEHMGAHAVVMQQYEKTWLATDSSFRINHYQSNLNNRDRRSLAKLNINMSQLIFDPISPQFIRQM